MERFEGGIDVRGGASFETSQIQLSCLFPEVRCGTIKVLYGIIVPLCVVQ